MFFFSSVRDHNPSRYALQEQASLFEAIIQGPKWKLGWLIVCCLFLPAQKETFRQDLKMTCPQKEFLEAHYMKSHSEDSTNIWHQQMWSLEKTAYGWLLPRYNSWDEVYHSGKNMVKAMPISTPVEQFPALDSEWLLSFHNCCSLRCVIHVHSILAACVPRAQLPEIFP